MAENNPDIQTRINDLALKANDKRYEAFLLEQEAIDINIHALGFLTSPQVSCNFLKTSHLLPEFRAYFTERA